MAGARGERVGLTMRHRDATPKGAQDMVRERTCQEGTHPGAAGREVLELHPHPQFHCHLPLPRYQAQGNRLIIELRLPPLLGVRERTDGRA